LYSIAIEWKNACPQGHIEVRNGVLKSLNIAKGSGLVRSNGFSEVCRLELEVDAEEIDSGVDPAVVSVFADGAGFSFLLRDVNSKYPIFIPRYGAAVIPASDQRSYEDIDQAIRKIGGKSKLEQIESETEESFDNAAAHTHSPHAPTWLGLSRDMRMFEFDDTILDPFLGLGPIITPRYPKSYLADKYEHAKPEVGPILRYNFRAGRGVSCVPGKTRCLEDGVLPIVVGKIVDDDITYDYTLFTSLERSALTQENVKGTHYLVAVNSNIMFNINPEIEDSINGLASDEFSKDEKTVLYCRVVATNTALVPRYAFFRAPLHVELAVDTYYNSGLGSFEEGKYFCTAKLNGKPWPKDEVAILVNPGETAVMDFALPYNQISKERALALLEQDFEHRHSECREYWLQKLQSAAKIQVPEQRISEMIQAGLLHLDLIAYGQEPGGTVAASVGDYDPIGTESAPIIQFFDSMGWHDLARRCLAFFFETQRDDGYIQNYWHYEVETQAVLWCAGEHYRYTRDDEWMRQIKPNLLKACEYLRAWRKRNMKEELRGKGYGMLEGAVADPEDPYRYFLANGYYSLGLNRVAEMLRNIDPGQAEKLSVEAESVRNDVRTALFDVIARSPLVPLGDGTWCPTVPVWAEASDPGFLLTGKDTVYHSTFVSRDALLGPMWLAFQEVVDPNEPAADVMVDYHTDILYSRNVAFGQPYYSRHPWTHLKRGEVKAFLKTYYNCFSGLADRDTYTFLEVFQSVSSHKTHEEAWFLMETRWMLYMEDGDTLNLLPGIPRDWMSDGKNIELENVASYFGSLTMKVQSQVGKNRITAKIECITDRKPQRVRIRLPHPDSIKAKNTSTGNYDPLTESVTIEAFTGSADLVIEF